MPILVKATFISINLYFAIAYATIAKYIDIRILPTGGKFKLNHSGKLVIPPDHPTIVPIKTYLN